MMYIPTTLIFLRVKNYDDNDLSVTAPAHCGRPSDGKHIIIYNTLHRMSLRVDPRVGTHPAPTDYNL